MQIVIDIDDETLQGLCDSRYVSPHIKDVFRSATLLPKGHGRIADIDEMIACIKDVEGEDASWGLALIEWAGEKRTIIEADRSEKT